MGRKPIKFEKTKNFIVEDYKNPPEKDVIGYRRKKVDGHVITIAILRKKGPRGGRTKITSLWHPKEEGLKNVKKRAAKRQKGK